ncbi:MAG TPA: outer membrane protein assembly factor BamA, partial [Smithellaceae bacterium]|nr:outer membrane protein assembly factor BamA [Smithellaceae bacterium]
MMLPKRLISISLTLLLCLSCLIIPAQAQEIKKICVLPFSVYGKDDTSSLKKNLYQSLSNELKKQKSVQIIPADEYLTREAKIDESQALAIGKTLAADYVVTGSMTQFGETVSIDARIIDVATGNISPAFSRSGKGPAVISSLAAKLQTDFLVHTGLIRKIAKIEVQGNRKIETSAVLQNIISAVGKPYSEDDIAKDVKTIYKKGYFIDIRAEAEETSEGMAISFIVQEKGLITEVRISGNKALSRDDITEVMATKTREVVNQEKIAADIEKIKALYDSKAYYNAEITGKVEREGEKDFRVVINIKENSKLYIKTITFEGNEIYSAKELKAMMTTNEKGFFSFISDSGLLKRDQLKNDVTKLNAYYFNNGFINAQVGEPEITIEKDGIYIKIKIREGKRFKVGKVEISGDLLEKTRTELLAALKTKTGNNYDREAVLKDIDVLVQACNDEGYANADVAPKINTRETEQIIDIDFSIDKGSLVYFNRINISGNTITRDKVIRRELKAIEGALYSSTKLKNSYANLNRLRYFEEIDFQTNKTTDKSKMDLNIRVKEKNTGMFMVGAGYSAQEQAIVTAQISQQNLLGRGETISLKAYLGSTTNNYELSYTNPWLLDIPLWSKVDVWKYLRQFDSYSLDTRGIGMTVGYPFWEQIFAYIGYKFTIDNIQDINLVTIPRYILDQKGQTITSALTLTVARDTTDDTIFPTKGTKATIAVTKAGGPLQGDASFIKYIAGLTGYYSIVPDLVFGAKGRVGEIVANDDKPIPVYERFVLGGINSLRGLR